jgi:hypothetical protein
MVVMIMIMIRRRVRRVKNEYYKFEVVLLDLGCVSEMCVFFDDSSHHEGKLMPMMRGVIKEDAHFAYATQIQQNHFKFIVFIFHAADAATDHYHYHHHHRVFGLNMIMVLEEADWDLNCLNIRQKMSLLAVSLL